MNFNDTYSRDNFRTLVKELLPDYTDDVRQVSAATPSPHIQEAHLLGESQDLELSVFEIQHSGSADKRISLAQAGFRLMKGIACYRALIAYHSTDTDSWRLSLMTLNPAVNEQGKVSLESSNPRRYSYFLGPDAKVHTPHDRLIRSGAIQDFDDLLARFSVEVVTNEFFKRYKDLFEKLVKHLEKDHAFIGFAARSNVAIEDFAKKLLGQIVFIYFLQRKRWVGAKKGKSIHEGDKDFLRSLFHKATSEQKNFFNEYLEPLFYDGLNNPPKRAGSFYRAYFDCQIPFLNGGLFEPLNNYDWRNAFLFIPDELFSNDEATGILDVFDLYNFTVAEDDPIDVEVSVDPEMLGKVFENLLAENLRKGKGTYYTPRAIVHYMCRESLINYLASESKIDEEKIRQLVEQKNRITDVDLAKLDSIEEHETAAERVLIFDKVVAKKVDALLKDIKVCDPACGSGAFLVGMLHEIVNARHFLDSWYFGDRYTNYNLKKFAIQHSVYGVDIDPGAVDIAKLRLWLSMVVDYDLDDIEPLPNLDYKIMQGNSLLEELVVGDITLKLYDPKLNNGSANRRKKNLFEEDDQQDLFGQTKGQHRLIDELNRLHREYFELSDLKAKRRKREQIKAIEHDLVERTVKQELKKLEGQSKNIGNYLSPVKGMSKKDAEEYAENLSKQTQLSAILKEFDASTNRPYFLWHLNFADVFEQKGGFDMVVANPPYDVLERKRDAVLIEYVRKSDVYNYSLGGKLNIYRLFIEKGWNLSNKTGVLCYIVPSTLIADKNLSGIRRMFRETKSLAFIAEFPEKNKVFDAVTQATTIFLADHQEGRESFDLSVNLRSEDLPPRQKVKISWRLISQLFGNLIPFPLVETEDQFELVLKLYSSASQIKDIADVYQGDINLTAYKEYLSSKNTGVYLVRGEHIHPYRVDISNQVSDRRWFDLPLLAERSSAKAHLIKERFQAKRIVCQNIANMGLTRRIRAAELPAEVVVGHSANCLSPQGGRLSILAILGLLNSSTLNWMFKKLSTNNHVNIYELEALPVPKITREQSTELERLVGEIQKATVSTEVNNTRKYQSEIDKLIYNLYGLTVEEIKIIESVN